MVPHLNITLIFQQGISIESEPQQLLGVSLLKQNNIAVDKEGGGGGRDKQIVIQYKKIMITEC